MSIDPYPRAEVDLLCDDVQRSPLESVDLSVFDRLRAGDVLFRRVQPTLPAKYVSDHPDFRTTLDRLWGDPHFGGVERHGDAFWFTTGTP